MSDLNSLTIAGAREKLRAGDITALELTQACLCLLYTSDAADDVRTV